MPKHHLLVTNDFPPKVGGIQSYLWELWSRMPPGYCSVLAPSYPGCAEFDEASPIPIFRSSSKVLLPTPKILGEVKLLASQVGADLVLLDPALPLGAIGPFLGVDYGLVVHGAEVAIPSKIAGLSAGLKAVVKSASVVVAAGGYPAQEIANVDPSSKARTVVIPPGVDASKFVPSDDAEKLAVRRNFGLADYEPLIVSVSRLVPRKGMDKLIVASARLKGAFPGLGVAIAGAGRDASRLRAMAKLYKAPVEFVGKVSDQDLAGFYGCGDLFVMDCRSRWGGLEQEGFGIVFLEAASCGIAQVAGKSGGSFEAVEDGMSGAVVSNPAKATELTEAIGTLLSNRESLVKMGEYSRQRAVNEFNYPKLAADLIEGLETTYG